LLEANRLFQNHRVQARKSVLIAGAAAALTVGIIGWIIVGRWAYRHYLVPEPISFAPTGSTARAAAAGIVRSTAELLAQTPGVTTNSCVILGTYAEAETQRWSSIPKGLFETNDVTFFCDGAIRLNGLTRARGKQSPAPGAIVDIPVNLKGNRLHWLHASENSGGTPSGASYATIVLHYEDGTQHRVDLRYNVHGRDWFGSKRFADVPIPDPNTSVVWAVERRDGSHINFYHTIMSNPAPHLTIVTMDVISPLNPANVLLVGAAVTSSDQPLNPSPLPDPEPFRAVVNFVMKDDGAPTPQGAAAKRSVGTLQWTVIGPGLNVEYPALRADPAGKVSIDVPLRPVSEIHYQATSPGGATAEGTVQKDENGNFPEERIIVLKSTKP
jgi:hypothetical protein